MAVEGSTMSVLVIYESMFGNTEAIAEAVAEGVRQEAEHAPPGPDVTVVHVAEAPTSIPDDVTMLLVGGPTHAFSMSRESTRADAVREGATGSPRVGIREWIDACEPRADLPVHTFDTRVHVRMMPGSAAKQAATALRHKGFRQAQRGESFWVGGKEGPLSHDEVVRARAWGAFLAGALAPA
jgi:hypothetical protein